MTSGRRIAILALGMLGALLAVAQFVLVGLTWSHPDAQSYTWRPAALAQGVISLVFIVVGLFVARRRSDNPIGWLVAAIGLSNLVYQAVTDYAVFALLVSPGTLPWANEAGALSQLLWALPFGMVPVLLLVYPTGRFLTPRWAVVAIVSGLAVALILADIANLWRLRPLGRDLLFLDEVVVSTAGETLLWAGLFTLIGALVSAVTSVFLRWHRGDRIERLQIKWLLVSGILLLIQAGLAISGLSDSGVFSVANEILLVLGLLSLPFAIAVAVLRYRLFEIDRIVSRTLTYGVATALLAIVYLGSVFILRSLMPVEGQLAVAGSTLATAALFNPVRRRVQRLVDRRFNRLRYDAEQMLSAFTARLSDQIDLASLRGEVHAVAEQTVQPSSISLWLRHSVNPELPASG